MFDCIYKLIFCNIQGVSTTRNSTDGVRFFMQNNKFWPIPDVQYFRQGDRMSCGYVSLSWKRSTVELHLSGLKGTASSPDMQKIRIIGFKKKKRLHWQFEAEKISIDGYFRPHIYLCTNKTLFGCWLLTFTANEHFWNSFSYWGTPPAVTVYQNEPASKTFECALFEVHNG